MVNDQDYGANMRDSLARYDPATHLLKMSQLCLFGDLIESSATLPRSGTMRSGIVYQLPTLAPGIEGTEFGLLPTPTASGYKGSVKGRFYGSPTFRGNLTEALRNGPEDPIYPHPDFVELMMGFPIGHTALDK